MRRNLDDKKLGQSKVLCSFLEVELPMVNYHAGFPVLPTPEKQISDYPPASGSSKTILTRTPSYRLFFVASSYLACFLTCLVCRPRFCFRGSVGLTVGLAMGEAESRRADIAVAFSG